ncbi:MAG: hypothetical protein ABI298_05640 [Acidimicrobiales bacterium]
MQINNSDVEDSTSKERLNVVDYTFLVQNACRDLMIGLGRLINAVQQDSSLPPFEPAIWKGLSTELFVVAE